MRLSNSIRISVVPGLLALFFAVQGAWAQSPAAPFFTLTPCRIFDSRIGDPPPLTSGVPRVITLVGVCGIPDSATDVTLNITAVSPTSTGSLAAYASDTATPATSVLNFNANKTRANNAVVHLSADGKITILPTMVGSGSLDLILDTGGYFGAAAPVLTASGATATFTEGGSAVVVDPGITVTSVSSANLVAATVTITNPQDGAAEVLAATSCPGLTVTPGVNTLSITGSQPLATYQTCLQSVTYSNSSENPGTTPRSLTFTADDGTFTGNTTETVNVAGDNDAPTVTTTVGATTFTEDGGPVVVDAGVTVADLDNANLASATVAITNPQDGAAEVLAATSCAGLTVTPGVNTLAITGSQPLATYQTCLQSVTYNNTSQDPDTTARTISFVVNDGTAASTPATKTVNVVAVNDAPVVTTTGGPTSFTEDGGPVVVDAGVTVSDVDDANLTSATVAITNPQDGAAEVLAATSCAGLTVTPGLNTLAITGSQPLATYQTCLRSVTYDNTSQNPSTTARVISFVVNDGTVASTPATKTVTITTGNDLPVVTTTVGATTFTEDGGPVVIDAGVTVTDPDDANLASATVTITNPQDGAAEVLAATSCAGLTVTPGLNFVTITGSQPLATYQTCLRSVTYENTSQNPNTTARTIAFIANDGTMASVPANKTVNVVAVNDAPVVTTTGGATSFTEDGGAVVVDAGVAVSDVDNANLASATVTITNPQDGAAEVLAATSCAGLTVTPGLNTLSITGSQPPAVYQTCLRSVTYNNTSQNPGTTARVISFVVNDGTTASTPATKMVTVTAVNDAPVVTTTAGITAFTEDGGPVVVDSLLTVTDADSANLASATVTITNPQDGASEILAATSCAGLTVTPGVNTLSITGSQPPATYQTCLRSVTYNNTSQNPGTTARVVSFVVNDGALASTPATKTVSVAAVNDAPVVTTTGGSTSFTEDGGAVVVDAGVTVTDVDSNNLTSATVTITNPQNGAAEVLAATSCAGLTVTPGLNTLSITGSQPLATYQTCLRSVTYNNSSQNPGTTARSISFVVNDGTASSTPATKTVTVTAVNDAPVVTTTGGASSFTEDGGAIVIDSGVTVSDVDNANLASATVTITNPQDGALEVLGATSCAGLTVTPGSGTLSISGSQTLAVYQTCLRSVTYNNSSQNPNPTTRVISFVVSDGALASTPATKMVTVTPVPDPPVLTNNPITYVTPGNTQLHVAGATLPGVASWSDPQSALTKAAPTDVDGPVAPAVVPASGSSTNGGTYAIDAAGKFTYVPPVGFTGTDSFNYQVTDTVAQTTGTINITVGPRVWYIHKVTSADNPAGGDGRSTNAFDSIAAFNAATTFDGDIIYVFEADSATTPYTGPIALRDGQKLWGQGIALNVPGFGTPLANATAQSRIRTSTASTDVVSVPATAGKRDNVEIRGLDLEATGATSNAIDVTASGANVVGVTISNDNVRGATAEGIDLNAGNTVAFSVTVQNDTITAAGNGVDTRLNASGTATITAANNTITVGNNVNAFDARTLAGAGALRVSLSDGSYTAGTSGNGVVIDGSAAGTTTITGFANNVVSPATGGSGILVTSATFDQTPGGAFQTVSGGTSAVGVSGDGVGLSGIVLTNVAGDLSFTDLDVFASAGAGLRASGTTPYTGSAGFQIAVTGAGVATAMATGGPAVDLSNVRSALPFQLVTSASSPTTGVALNTLLGSFSAASGSISGAAGTSFQVGSSNATISYAGSINATTGKGVDLTSNTGSTIGFTGALTFSTGTNTAFNATGGGTVTATDTTSTLTTTTATALSVVNTTIGATGLKFRSIASNGGGNSGIVLNNTGSSGGLTVLGNSGTCSSVATCTGGAIQNKTGDGISLNNTRDVSLSLMAIDNNDGSGIFGDDLTNFSLLSSRVTNSGDTQNGSEAGLRFNELLGNCAITNSTISGSSEDNIRMTPTSGVLTNLAISGSSISSCAAPVACNGLALVATGTADLTFNVTGTTFQSNKSSAFLISVSNTSKATVNVSSSNFNDNTLGVDLSNALDADLTFDIRNNTLLRQANNAINIISGTTATNAAQLSGKIANNIIGDNTIDSGSRDAFGIGIDADGDVDAVISVTNNTIKHTDFEGIFAESAFDDDADAQTGKLDLTVTGNSVGAPDDNSAFPIGALYGVRLESRRTTALCLDISGNTAASTGGLQNFRVRQRDTSTYKLERFVGDGTNDATVAAFIAGQNTGGSTASATHATTYTGVANGACRKP